MKHNPFRLFILLGVFFLIINKSFSQETPKQSWEFLIDALKSGDDERVRLLTTQNGFSNLIQHLPRSMEDPLSANFISWGNIWSDCKIIWGEEEQVATNSLGKIKNNSDKFYNESHTVKMWPLKYDNSINEIYSFIEFEFIKTGKIWLLDSVIFSN